MKVGYTTEEGEIDGDSVVIGRTICYGANSCIVFVIRPLVKGVVRQQSWRGAVDVAKHIGLDFGSSTCHIPDGELVDIALVIASTK